MEYFEGKLKKTYMPIDKWISFIADEIADDRNNISGLDVIITDPPYPFDNKNGSGRHGYSDGTDNMYDRLTFKTLSKIYLDIFNLMNPGGRIYIFTNRDGLEDSKRIMIGSGFRYLNTLVWNKIRLGGGYHWRNSVEYIHYFCKPKSPAILVKNASNIFSYPKPTRRNEIPEIEYFPTRNQSAKPSEIWRDIIMYGCQNGDIIADPFAGSDPLAASIYLDKELRHKIGFAYTNSF